MQRFLSLATLGVLGGLVWMFLSGGGLSQLAVDPATGQPAAAQPGGFDLSGLWKTQTAAPTAGAPGTTTPVVSLPPAIGGAAPPMGAGQTIRIASFNIQVFGDAKAGEPAVMATLAEIVRRFHVVAIQEIRTTNTYHMPNFVKLINSTGRKYDHVIGDRLGNTVSKEQYAFIYDTEAVDVDQQSVYTVGDPDNLLHREPLVASFRTRVSPNEAFTFILMNVHVDPNYVQKELEALAEAFRAVRRASQGEDDVIMLGDFNADDLHLGRLTEIPEVSPLVSRAFSNTRSNRLLDNIVIHKPSTTEYAGVSGAYDYPRELKLQLSLDQIERISDHYPVWAEFSVYERDYQGRIASRRTTAR